jgi:hypothetical protein
VIDKAINSVHIYSILPGNPPQPCPDVLTEDEAIKYLRLDEIDIASAADTLRYYRKKGLLLGTQIRKRLICPKYRCA